MNGLLERQQTSGNAWGPQSSSQVYFQQQAGLDRKQAATPVQVSDFAAFEAQMTEHTEEFRRILKDLQRQFIVNDPQSVEAFLKSHRASASTLIESVPYLAESFGPNTPLALEIMAEDGPKDSARYGTLSIRVDALARWLFRKASTDWGSFTMN